MYLIKGESFGDRKAPPSFIAELVVGVAEARPNRFSNLRPHMMSTKPTGMNFASWGSEETMERLREGEKGRER